MKNRILARILSIAMLLSLCPLFQLDVYAQPHEVQIRVEGKEKTLYQRTVTVTDEVYCQDYLNSLGNTIGDGWISTLFDETPLWDPNEDSWMNYYVKQNTIDNSKSVNQYKLNDADEIILYVSNFNENVNSGAGTLIPVVTTENYGDTVGITVYGKGWGVEQPYGGAPIRISYMDEVQKTDSYGQYSFRPQGVHKVVIGDYPNLVRKTIYVGEEEILNKVKNAIEDVKNYYNSCSKFNAWVAPAYYGVSSTDQEFKDIQRKYTTVLDNDADVNAYAHHIIGLLAAGKDPKNADGKSYVQILANMQQPDGKFLKTETDPFYVTYQSFAVLALDLAEADYDKSGAIQAILTDQRSDGSFGDWGTDGTAMTLFALANHKNESGVSSAIDRALSNLKNQQADTGGFTSFGSESAESTAMVMKALIALDINPLSDEWLSSTGKNMLDALLSYSQDGQFINSWSGEPNDMTTEQAFSALVDLYKAESIYQNQSLKYHYQYAGLDDATSGYDFELNRKDANDFKKGEEAKLDITVQNNSDSDQQATYIVTLCNIDEMQKELYTYTFLTKMIPAGNAEDFGGGFLIPSEGDYEVKAMLWNNFEDKQPLAEPITVNVQ